MIEKKPVIFLLLATVVILIGTAITMIAPFRWINDPKLKIAEVKPYTPLQLEGRDIYIREGCNNCHTQTVRPLMSDVERYGDYSKAGEFIYDQPHLWGSRRTGPDLARIGGKYPDAWHYKHIADPQSIVPKSNMPKYAFLQKPLDTSLTERKMKALKFPYTPADIDVLKGKSEMDAMVAYMQKLGNDIPWRQAAKAVLNNPFQGNAAAIIEGKDIYDKQCAQCHGADLQGGMAPGAKNMLYEDAELFRYVYSGVPAKGMPAYGDSLGQERIWKVITFIRSKQKP
jgi:cytochrome c oxidase cbb3-type subunit 2